MPENSDNTDANRNKHVELLKLNLGCGQRHLGGYINVDKYGSPDLRHDLETFPWPWDNDSVSEIKLIHVLEHLGQSTQTYLDIIKEMYRVCRHEASIHIIVPHHRHQYFFDDPTHVRAITPMGMELFSKRLNRSWVEGGAANSPLGLYLDVNFELKSVILHPSQDWFRLHPEEPVDTTMLMRESNIYNNLIEQIEMELIVIKEEEPHQSI
ncbi:MAG: class I SAM-dependent methyltransferase [Cyanobium sp.]